MGTAEKHERNTEKGRWSRVKRYITKEMGPTKIELGTYFAFNLWNTPRHLIFALSRYKFAAKLIGETPKRKVLELGCSEGLGTLILGESGHKVVGVDFDSEAIKWAKANLERKGNLSFKCDDFLGKTYGVFDAIISLDTVEHIPTAQEQEYFQTLTKNLATDGICILGTPNITSAKYASKQTKMGHVNLYSAERLRDSGTKYFRNVFVFGMNDEIVHTGYYPMSQYLIMLGCGKKAK